MSSSDRDVLDYDTALEYGDKATEDRATDYGTLLAQAPAKQRKGKTPSKSKSAKQLKKVSKLLVTDATDDKLKKLAPIHARQIMKVKQAEIKNVVRQANSWSELIKILEEYESIDDLTLMFHGTPGSLIIGNENKSLSETGSLFTGDRPTIKNIDFEACSVAENPEELVSFARLFKTSKTSGWNHFRVVQNVDVEVPQNVDVAALRQLLADFEGYFLPSTPTIDELAKNPGKYTLIAEWFRRDYNEDPLPNRTTAGPDVLRSYIPRSAGNPIKIRSGADVEKLRKRYEATPVAPLEHVIITISP